MSGIFKAYDIRGSYPDELNEGIAKRIGEEFVRLLNAGRIVVGRDMRLSSPVLKQAFAEGAITSGASVMDLGMVTTPLLYYAIIEGKFDGGAMITASHLSREMNGFKLCREKAIPLSGDQGLPALESLVTERLPEPPSQVSPGSCQKIDFLNKYVDKLSTFVHNPKPLKIVVDVGNGMAGAELKLLFKKVRLWQFIPMYMEPDGKFPHHIANPLLKYATRDLENMVVKERADVGIAFDGDADRCGFIDDRGERVPEDLVTALIGEFLLAKKTGITILYDLRSSRIVPETITRLKGRAVRCRVGHAFIKTKMREEDALFAGELSGHYYYRDMGFTDNAMLTMIHMLNFLSLKGQPLSDLIRPLKKYYSTGEINLRIKAKEAVFALLESAYKDARKDHLDGLTVQYDSWWFNLRASNTEPVIRLNLEANELNTMEQKQKEVIEYIKKADSTMKIQDA
jgi:phosphomannomutase